MVQLYITPYYIIIIITQSDHYANIESNVLCTYLVNACASTPRGPNMQHNNIECLHGVPHSMASKNTHLAKNTSKEIKWSQDAHAVSGVDMKFEKSVKHREMKGSALAPEAAAVAIPELLTLPIPTTGRCVNALSIARTTSSLFKLKYAAAIYKIPKINHKSLLSIKFRVTRLFGFEIMSA